MLRYATKMGYELSVLALTLYFTLIDHNTPNWARTVIVSALAYLIMPIDAVPDFVPIAGYSDDIGVIGAALAIVATHVTEDHRLQARRTADGWFGTQTRPL